MVAQGGDGFDLSLPVARLTGRLGPPSPRAASPPLVPRSLSSPSLLASTSPLKAPPPPASTASTLKPAGVQQAAAGSAGSAVAAGTAAARPKTAGSGRAVASPPGTPPSTWRVRSKERIAVRKAKGLIGAAHESPEWLMDLGRRMNIPFDLLAVFSEKCQRPTPRHPSASPSDPHSAPTPECVQAAHLINHTVQTRLASSSSTAAAEAAAAVAERGGAAAAAAATDGPGTSGPVAAAAAGAPVVGLRGVPASAVGGSAAGVAAGGAAGGGVVPLASSTKEQQPAAATAGTTHSPDSSVFAKRAAPVTRPAARAPGPAPAAAAATERWGWRKNSSSRGLWGRLGKGPEKKKAEKKAQKMPEASRTERNSIMDGTLVPASRAVNPPMSRNPMFEPVGASKRRAARQPGLRVPMCIKTVKVQFGDTLAEIALKHRTSIRDLQRLNNLRSDFIVEGDTLIVSCSNQRRSVPELRPGIRRTCRPLFSRLSPSSLANLPTRLGVGGPAAGAIVKSASAAAGARVSLLEGRWRRGPKGFPKSMDGWLRFNCPVVDGFVSSPFGWRWGSFHEGVDLAAEFGAPVLASDKGVVTFAGWSGGYGKLVTIAHDNGFTTRYGHCCIINARVGQRVARGQQVACVGATGRATGPHLHFEVRKRGEALDPFKWCNL
ncbi:hypothetical protein CLOP_g22174 [Closterium sp. NIES-67]|nr:hypothetical protein CLOP_g22174 [Closterium sp. NIES-67]